MYVAMKASITESKLIITTTRNVIVLLLILMVSGTQTYYSDVSLLYAVELLSTQRM